jgi:hypothetical protein
MKKLLLLAIALVAHSTYEVTATSYCAKAKRESNSTYCSIEKILKGESTDADYEILRKKLKQKGKTVADVDTLKMHLERYMEGKISRDFLIRFIKEHIVLPVKVDPNLPKGIEKLDSEILGLIKRSDSSRATNELKVKLSHEKIELENKRQKLLNQQETTRNEIDNFLKAMREI